MPKTNTLQIQNTKRHHQNSMVFIFLYGVVGVITGLMFDALFTYLSYVSPDTSKGIASYMGAATLVAAFIAIFAPKIGYKRIMAAAFMSITSALILIANTTNLVFLVVALLFIMSGTTMFDIILAPFIAAHATDTNRTRLYTQSSIACVLGIILGTSLGGPMIVWIFSADLGCSYQSAMTLTQNINALNTSQFAAYIHANKLVILAFAGMTFLSLLFVLLIKENKSDYTHATKVPVEVPIEVPIEKKAIFSNYFKALTNKYVLLFLLYTIIGRFAAALIAPQISLYLTKLGIDRASISFLGTLQYVSILGFTALSPWLVRKMGQVYAIAFLGFASIPFMAIMANGNNLGNSMVFIIGAALFFRAGFSNASIPAVNALTMTLVTKNDRSLYASLIFVMQSVAQIIAGYFGKVFLFSQPKGYATAYYYAAVIYVLANLLLIGIFAKKYNRPQIEENSHH